MLICRLSLGKLVENDIILEHVNKRSSGLFYTPSFKGHLLCKIHFFMSFIHKHVSPLCEEILNVSGGKMWSLFVLIHLYMNLSENELIRFGPLYDVITMCWLV